MINRVIPNPTKVPLATTFIAWRLILASSTESLTRSYLSEVRRTLRAARATQVLSRAWKMETAPEENMAKSGNRQSLSAPK